MADAPDNRELAHRIELLKKGFDVLKADISATLDQMTSDAAKRQKENQRWIVGFGIAQIVLTITVVGAGFAFLSILISLPD